MKCLNEPLYACVSRFWRKATCGGRGELVCMQIATASSPLLQLFQIWHRRPLHRRSSYIRESISTGSPEGQPGKPQVLTHCARFVVARESTTMTTPPNWHPGGTTPLTRSVICVGKVHPKVWARARAFVRSSVQIEDTDDYDWTFRYFYIALPVCPSSPLASW